MPPRLRHKFNAVRTERNGASFQSGAEARYYDQLLLRQRAGEVLFFLRQVRFDLPGGVVYRVDFEIFEADGTVRFVDVKGRKGNRPGLRTETYLIKKRIVEATYPVTIEEA